MPNTYTVTVSDQHSNSVPQPGIPASSKQEAVRNRFNHSDADWSILTATDNWTITVTQP